MVRKLMAYAAETMGAWQMSQVGLSLISWTIKARSRTDVYLDSQGSVTVTLTIKVVLILHSWLVLLI